jgi:hypothetical protein
LARPGWYYTGKLHVLKRHTITVSLLDLRRGINPQLLEIYSPTLRHKGAADYAKEIICN